MALKTPNEKDDHVRRVNHDRQNFGRFNNQNQTMKHKLKYYGLSLLTAAAATFFALPASAQQVTGELGSPSATTTIVMAGSRGARGPDGATHTVVVSIAQVIPMKRTNRRTL